MPQPKQSETIAVEKKKKELESLREKISKRVDICTLSELSEDTISQYDCEKISIYIMKKCMPIIDFLQGIGVKEIEVKKVKTGEYVNVDVQYNSWKQVFLVLLFSAYATREWSINKMIEKEKDLKKGKRHKWNIHTLLTNNDIIGKELQINNCIPGFQTMGSSGELIYAEEFVNNQYIHCTYSDKALSKAIKGLVKLLDINADKSLLKLKPRKELQQSNRYQVGHLFKFLPLVIELGTFFLQGMIEGVMVFPSSSLKIAMEKEYNAKIFLIHPDVNPRKAYEEVEQLFQTQKAEESTNTGYLLAYPLINGHLDILKNELRDLNGKLFKKYTIPKIQPDQYESLIAEKSIQLPKEILEGEIIFLLFNAKSYYDALYPKQTS